MFWSETTVKRELKGFVDGINDARRRTIDSVAYQVNREYRSGVDIAQQLMARFDNHRMLSLTDVHGALDNHAVLPN